MFKTNKQIDEMAKTMCLRKHCPVESCTALNCEKTWLAQALYDADYRKSSDVAKEIFGKLRNDLIGIIDPNYFNELEKIYAAQYHFTVTEDMQLPKQ